MCFLRAPVTCSEYGDRYLLIGPLSYKSAPMEVEAAEPNTPELRATLDALQKAGVRFLYGRWLIEGGPKVLLFDTGSMMHRLDEWKADLWNLAGIPTPNNDSETNETVVFGYLVAWFLGEVGLLHENSNRDRDRMLTIRMNHSLPLLICSSRLATAVHDK